MYPRLNPGLKLLEEFVVGSRPCSHRCFSWSSPLLKNQTFQIHIILDPDYCQALYHEPLAWEIAQALPVLLTLNKLLYFTLLYTAVSLRTGHTGSGELAARKISASGSSRARTGERNAPFSPHSLRPRFTRFAGRLFLLPASHKGHVYKLISWRLYTLYSPRQKNVTRNSIGNILKAMLYERNIFLFHYKVNSYHVTLKKMAVHRLI